MLGQGLLKISTSASVLYWLPGRPKSRVVAEITNRNTSNIARACDVLTSMVRGQ